MLHSWRKQKDVLRQIPTDMVIRRVGIFRIMVDRTLWPNKPLGMEASGPEPEPYEDETDEEFEERIDHWRAAQPEEVWEVRHRRKNPIVFQRRDPRVVRWREADDGELLVVVEHYQTSKVEALHAFARYEETAHALRNLMPDELVWVDDVWIGRYRCLILNDIPLFEVGGVGPHRGIAEHGYPEMPYVVVPFRELTFDDMERRYRGMLTNAAGLYPIESNVLTMQVWMLAINAWRTYLGWTKDGREIQIRPGQYIPIDQRIGEYLQMLEGQPVPDELLQTNSVVDNYIQRNGVAQGPRSAEGTRSAQQLWAIQSMRTLKIESAKDALVRAITRALELAAMELEVCLQDRLTLPVPGKDRNGDDMGEVTIKPEDVDGYWDGWEVSLGRRLDPAMLEQWKALQALQTNKWMPHRTQHRTLGRDRQPAGVARRTRERSRGCAAIRHRTGRPGAREELVWRGQRALYCALARSCWSNSRRRAARWIPRAARSSHRPWAGRAAAVSRPTAWRARPSATPPRARAGRAPQANRGVWPRRSAANSGRYRDRLRP